jgi:hypothetical protein
LDSTPIVDDAVENSLELFRIATSFSDSFDDELNEGGGKT